MSLGRVLVVGYTGETGKELLKALPKVKSLEKVTLCGRRTVELDPEIKEKATQVQIDFENVPKVSQLQKAAIM